LKDLKELGYVKIFSDNLGEATGVTAAQVRKDFSLFGISGNKKGGYLIDNLIEKINSILGKDEVQKVIMVGAGNLGSALARYRGFEKEDIDIVAAFDADPAKQGKINNIQVYPIKDVFEYVRNNKVRVAILAVPATVAQEVSEILVSAGIKGILNFAPVTLRVPERMVINNVSLAIELENVIYYVNARARGEKQKNEINP
jgi:redox-sensing transcriptional repressor